MWWHGKIIPQVKKLWGSVYVLRRWTFSIPSTICPWNVSKPSKFKEWPRCIRSLGGHPGKCSQDTGSNFHILLSLWMHPVLAMPLGSNSLCLQGTMNNIAKVIVYWVEMMGKAFPAKESEYAKAETQKHVQGLVSNSRRLGPIWSDWVSSRWKGKGGLSWSS